MVHQEHPFPDLCRIGHGITTAADWEWVGNSKERAIAFCIHGYMHTKDSKAVFRGKDAPEEFRTELVKTVAAIVIRRCKQENPAADTNQSHHVLQGSSNVKDMFQGSPVEDKVVPPIPILWDGLIEIMNALCSFVVRNIAGFDLLDPDKLKHCLQTPWGDGKAVDCGLIGDLGVEELMLSEELDDPFGCNPQALFPERKNTVRDRPLG